MNLKSDCVATELIQQFSTPSSSKKYHVLSNHLVGVLIGDDRTLLSRDHEFCTIHKSFHFSEDKSSHIITYRFECS